MRPFEARTSSRRRYGLVFRTNDAIVGEMFHIADRDLIEERLAVEKVVAPAELADAFGLRNATSPRGAGVIARMAATRFAAADADDLATLEPLYLRAPRGLSDEAAGEVRWL